MDSVVRDEVHKVRVFSRFARALCVLALVLMSVALLLGILGILARIHGVRMDFGPYMIDGSNFTTPFLQAWGILFGGLIFAFVFRWLFHLYALFDSLVAGNIYTAANVLRIRQIGLLMLYLQVLVVVLALTSLLWLKAGFIGEASVIRQPWGITPGSFYGLLAPGVILLASWIMEVGRKTREEADEMRREAEFVV
ncbi:MAG TPA: hypothetical protein VGM84_17080 [Steroidobacteraceae bacterium]|jgi:hypothetical protein